MTAPAEAAGRFLWAVMLGAVLGGIYDWLRPLRPRHTWLSDGLFLASTGYMLVYLAFGVCRGDLRMGYLFGLLTGWFLWEWTVGMLLRPIFSGFWKIVAGIAGFFCDLCKKFQKL